MSDDFVTVEVCLHRYKMEALQEAASEEGVDIDDYMQDRLIDLYSELVPEEVQQEIRERIDAEHTAGVRQSAEQQIAGPSM